MAIDFNIMIGGEAGQGVQSVGIILARALAGTGLNVFADQDYESRVRGGHNFFRIRAGDSEVPAVSEKLDVLVALNEETVAIHRDEVRRNGVIIGEGERPDLEALGKRYFNLPMGRLAEANAGNKLMANTVAAGAAVGLAGFDIGLLIGSLRREFASHGGTVAEDNVRAAQAGYDYAFEHGTPRRKRRLRKKPADFRGMLLNGNEAIAMGAIVAGCKFTAGYPMTPASSILEFLANNGRTHNVVAVHAEDEIAAMNMAVGAAYAGVRSMVATSGGGFSLMVEGLSLAGITETPVVVVLAQRPGPATGLPTRTEQGELWYALHAGHGEFPRAVLAPSTAEEAFYATINAFNLAEKYQTPVILLTDHHLATSYATVARFDLRRVRIDRGWLLSDREVKRQKLYKRHKVTPSGISPRVLPGQGKALVVTDSDEHDETGHLIEDAATRKQQHEKRLRKYEEMAEEIGLPRFDGIPEARYTLAGWGSTYGAMKGAADLLLKKGIPVNVLCMGEIWPYPKLAMEFMLDKKIRTITVENNATAQLAGLIRRESGYKVSGSILKYDGRPFSPQEIAARFRKEVR